MPEVGHGAHALGIASAALEAFTDAVNSRPAPGSSRQMMMGHVQADQIAFARADALVRAARALLHESYEQLYATANAGQIPDGAAIAEVRAAALYATDVAVETVTQVFHFAGNTGLHHPHVIGRLVRDLNTAGLHQVMSDTAYENHGKFRLGIPADPLA